jgi:hypothetical protein
MIYNEVSAILIFALVKFILLGFSAMFCLIFVVVEFGQYLLSIEYFADTILPVTLQLEYMLGMPYSTI